MDEISTAVIHLDLGKTKSPRCVAKRGSIHRSGITVAAEINSVCKQTSIGTHLILLCSTITFEHELDFFHRLQTFEEIYKSTTFPEVTCNWITGWQQQKPFEGLNLLFHKT